MDYGHDLLFGTFVTPTAQAPQQAVELAVLADRAGLDLVTFQDHPYQPSFLDTWTLLTYAAARTERIHLSGNVLNLPLRPPAVLAKAAASLDRLSGGRFELGIGAGGFWDAIAAMGGPRRTPGEALGALREGISIIRDLWDTTTRERVSHHGRFYDVEGAKRGPSPAHDIGIWIGAYKPRMLGLIGEVADGWLPSLPYLPQGPASLPAMNAAIDEGAASAGRAPSAVRRLLNLGADATAEQLADLALTHGISGFIVMADDPVATLRLAEEIAPATRELVAAERARRGGVSAS